MSRAATTIIISGERCHRAAAIVQEIRRGGLAPSFSNTSVAHKASDFTPCSGYTKKKKKSLHPHRMKAVSCVFEPLEGTVGVGLEVSILRDVEDSSRCLYGFR